MEDMAATAPAAHIILLTHTHMWKFAFTKHGLLVRCCSIGGLRLVSTETFLVIYRQKYNLSVCSTQTTHTHKQISPWLRSEAVPGQLKDLEAQSKQNSIFITQSPHQQSQEECLRRKTVGGISISN